MEGPEGRGVSCLSWTHSTLFSFTALPSNNRTFGTVRIETPVILPVSVRDRHALGEVHTGIQPRLRDRLLRVARHGRHKKGALACLGVFDSRY